MIERGLAARGGRPAFTLVELLISVAILAVGMVFVLASMSRCALSLDTAEKMIAASRLLNHKMWELQERLRLDEDIQSGTEEGEFSEPFERFRWTLTVDEVSADFGVADLFVKEAFVEAVQEIRWRQGKSERFVEAVQYLPRPEEAL